MSDPQPVELFATPVSREALINYMNLFSVEEEQEAAQFGFANFNSEQLDVGIDKFSPAARIVALTVAGMRWNLYCKEVAEARNESE